jgi:hypothetical protein
MKKVILVVCLLPYMAYGQITDSFEAGSIDRWKQYPDGRWKADTSESISENYSLHHIFNNSDAGTDQAGILIDSLQPADGVTRWSFTIRHGCDPSASNNWAVFLMSDSDPSSVFSDGLTNGYAIGVNLSGNDDTLRLWKVSGNLLTIVVNTHLNWQSSVTSAQYAKIEVMRDRNGTWNVTVLDANGNQLAFSTGTDSELFDCRWFIINYKYTSSRDQLLWFDDLRISGVFHTGNEIPDTLKHAPGEVIISEIMADPEPVVSLPPCEYLEITNTTENHINLNGWKLSTGTLTYTFPEFTIKPFEAVIVSSLQDTSEFSASGRIIGLKQMPALTDYGRLLLLYDKSGTLIHGVDYSSRWYGDELKSEGGWSLEMIDTKFPFYYENNWKASESHTGGTPGRENSVSGNNPDDTFSGLPAFFATDSIHIAVSSPEPLLTFPGMADSIIIEGIPIASIVPSDPLFRKFTLVTVNPLLRKKIYQAEITGSLHDFAGNIPSKSTYFFGLADTCKPGDVRFNELLFNPWPGDPDYIELYNTSNKIIDVSHLQLASVNVDTGDTSKLYLVSDDQRNLLPGSYYLASVSPGKVEARYFSADPENLFETAALPSMPDDKGHLVLFTRDLVKIDEVVYSEKMHSSLLSSFEGISLEKINPGFKSYDQANWRSATESWGWGTPGAPNSVLLRQPESGGEIGLSSSKITPDEDGIEDVLVINFNLIGNGNIVTVTVFDETGAYVRKIASNMSVGQGSTLVWDGKSDDGSLLETGIYIILIEAYNESGRTNKWKRICTIIRK